MALTAAGVIRTARDGHPSFTHEAHPDPVLVRALSAEQRRLVPKLVAENPSAVAVPLDPIIPSTFDFSAGLVLPEHHLIHDPGEAVTVCGHSQPVYKISAANRNLRRPDRAFYVHGGKLFLAGTVIEWSTITEVRITYVPVAADLTSMSATLVLPDAAESCLSRFLQAFMAGRRPVDGLDVRLKLAERDASEVDLLREVGQSFRATYMQPVRRR